MNDGNGCMIKNKVDKYKEGIKGRQGCNQKY